MKTICVKVQNDYLERMCRVQQPVTAIEELIWNGLDADATRVRVQLHENRIGGLDSITVSDNGHGMPFDEAITAFENLGGSWKRTARRTRKNRRQLHGQAGRGRFRAFALGTKVEWKTRFQKDSTLLEYEIAGDRQNLGTFTVTDPVPADTQRTGTEVEIRGIEKNFRSLSGGSAIQQVTEHFALYLREYPDVRIIYDGTEIDPRTVESHVEDYPLEPIRLPDGRIVSASLTVIEWRTVADRILYLCNAEGFALSNIPPGIQAPGFSFTAYVKSEFLQDLEDRNELDLEELQPDLRQVLQVTKEKLREHFRKRTAEGAVDLVEAWKREKVYPFENEPRDILEQTERQIFDVVALNVNAYLPNFEEADPKSKRFSLTLLKHALEESPNAVRRILQDVLELPTEKREEFAGLLERTSLTAIINAAKIVADRLDFLKGLEYMLFDPENRKTLLERTQLHRIVAEHTWVFGEEFHLSVDDQSLTEVLRKHLRLIGREAEELEPVLPVEGEKGIVDMMLSRVIPQPRADEREHLVVELKRPSKRIDPEVAQQAKDYAMAVAKDERFRDTKTRWVFIAVSNDMTEGIRREARQRHRPEGLLFDDEELRITVWVRTWGPIIEDCRARLKFFQEHLQFAANQDSAVAYLQKTHEKYLPKKFQKATS